MTGDTDRLRPSSESRVSVVVAARNAAGTVGALLAAMSRQTLDRARWEMLLVDDGSADDTGRLAAESGVARVVRAAGSDGSVYAARNRGIEEASGDVLAFTDADCVPARDWLEQGLAALDRSGADVLAGRLHIPIGSDPSALGMVEVTHYYDQERYVGEGHVAAGNLWATRDAVELLGGFDSRLRSGGDTDFGERAVAAGLRLAYAADVVVTHPPLTSLRVLARRTFRLGRGAAHRGEPRLRRRLGRRGSYVSRDYIRDRLRAEGHAVSRSKLIRIYFVKNVGIRLPMLVGNLLGIAEKRLRRRA